ncbi:hypothetical protein MP228_012494 [Amoeboaphelidium protococcarum]|nr:hypothetical protein MP228_012494 [Amoeboaphelidium protococcarum]
MIMSNGDDRNVGVEDSAQEEYLPVWITHDRRYPANPIHALNVEALEFVNFVTPQPHEHLAREWLVGRLRHIVHKLWSRPPLRIYEAINNNDPLIYDEIMRSVGSGDSDGTADKSIPSNENDNAEFRWADLVAIGSFPLATYLSSADLDVTIITNCDKVNQYEMLRQFSDLITKEVADPKSVTDVFTAVRPTVRFVDKQSDLRVNVYINHWEWKMGTDIVDHYLKLDRLGAVNRGLIMLFKYFLFSRGVHSAITGGIGSYAASLMVISFVENHPQLKDSNVNPVLHMGNLFMDFLEFYGQKYMYDKLGIARFDDNNQCGRFRPFKRDFKTGQSILCILDPADRSVDVGEHADKIEQIVQVLNDAYVEMNKALAERCDKFEEKLAQSGEKAMDTTTPYSVLSSVFSMQNSIIKVKRRLLKKAQQLLQPGAFGIEPSASNKVLNISNPSLHDSGPPRALFSAAFLVPDASNDKYLSSIKVPYDLISPSKLQWVKLYRGAVKSNNNSPENSRKGSESGSRSASVTPSLKRKSTAPPGLDKVDIRTGAGSSASQGMTGQSRNSTQTVRSTDVQSRERKRQSYGDLVGKNSTSNDYYR